jgi:hypothetical protein
MLAGISAGFAFKPILEDLAKEGAKEGGKAFFGSFCKGPLRQILPGMDPWKAVVAKVLKEFKCNSLLYLNRGLPGSAVYDLSTV